MTILYTAMAIWPEHNPVLGDHVIEAVLLGALIMVGAGRYLGLGARWERTALVRRLRILK